MFPFIGDVGRMSRSKFVNNAVDQSDVSFTKRQQEQSLIGAPLGFHDDIPLFAWHPSGDRRVDVGRGRKPFIRCLLVGDVEI